jgi:hypothetical protein
MIYKQRAQIILYMRKGQAEAVIILGVIVVVVVVVAYAFPRFVPPESPDVRVAKESVEGFIKNGLSDSINNITTYGGYSGPEDFPLGFVMLNGKEVPYWQYGGQIMVPDFRENLKSAVSSYLSEHRGGFLDAASSQGILESLGDPSVSSVNIMDGSVEVVVNMPTTAKEQAVPQPYRVSVPSRLKEMSEFSENFIQDSVQSNPIEVFTLATMVVSPIDEGNNEIPFFVFLTECGEFYMKTWYDLKPKMESAIERTLANVYMPGKAPLGTFETSPSPKYSLIRYGGKTHSDLDVSFFTPDDFELDPSTFQFTPSPIIAYSVPIPFVGECQSDAFYVRYYLNYPAIASVRDPESGDNLRFASQVYIINNSAADLGSFETNVQADICSDMQCSADITIEDGSGSPVQGASVSFMGCGLGRTGPSGRLQSPAPCGIGPLKVYASGFAEFSNMTSSNSLNVEVPITRTPSFNLHFLEANIVNNPISQNYQINDGELHALNDDHTNEMVYMSFYNIESGVLYQRSFNKPVGRINRIPAGDYVISATLNDDFNEVGGFALPGYYTLEEGLDGGDLYIYLPYSQDYSQISDQTDRATEMIRLTNLMIECGLGPVSDTRIDHENYAGCFRLYSEVLS